MDIIRDISFRKVNIKIDLIGSLVGPVFYRALNPPLGSLSGQKDYMTGVYTLFVTIMNR